MATWTNEGKIIGDDGGFGEVYRSRKKVGSVTLRTVYAKKKLTNLNPTSVERFQREVRLSSRLNHPRIIKVIASKLSEDPYFYIMPLYNCSMNQILNDLKGDFTRISTIINGIFDGVEYLHGEGVYHRDLKPANILMNSDDDIVISDFGLGVQPDSGSKHLTRVNTRMGTEFFASPEQWSDARNIDHRSDLFSIGRIIYCCFAENIDQNISYDNIPPAIAYLIRKSTADNKEDRFENVESMRKIFNGAIGTLQDEVTKNSFEDILNRMKSGDESIDFIDEISEALNRFKDDKDNIHEAIMSLSEDQFAELYKRHPQRLKKTLLTFEETTADAGWPFNYTDTIGRQCHELYYATQDYDVRATLIYTLARVGLSHNRFYVMDLTKEILKKVKDPVEGMVISDYINHEDRQGIKNLGLTKFEVIDSLKDLFK